jgi:hypothetical protein
MKFVAPCQFADPAAARRLVEIVGGWFDACQSGHATSKDVSALVGRVATDLLPNQLPQL